MIKLKKIVDSAEAVVELLKVKFPIKISFALSKLATQLEPELKIYNDKRNEILKELGTPQEENSLSYNFTLENRLKFNEELDKLTDIDIKVDFQKIKIADLGEIEIAPTLLVDWIFE